MNRRGWLKGVFAAAAVAPVLAVETPVEVEKPVDLSRYDDQILEFKVTGEYSAERNSILFTFSESAEIRQMTRGVNGLVPQRRWAQTYMVPWDEFWSNNREPRHGDFKVRAHRFYAQALQSYEAWKKA